jgi:hypothetical protein
LALIASANWALAREPALPPEHDLAAFERWVVANLNCRADFMKQVQTPEFLRQVRNLGVKVETDWVEGDTPEGTFVLPKPILIAKFPVTDIHYWGDSGAEFYATVAASAETVAKALGTQPVPARLKKEFDEKTIGVTFKGPVHSHERLAPALFVRRSDARGASEVGCVYFDG